MKKVVVDEAVSEEMGRQFLSCLQKKGFEGLDILFIAKEHLGWNAFWIECPFVNRK